MAREPSEAAAHNFGFSRVWTVTVFASLCLASPDEARAYLAETFAPFLADASSERAWLRGAQFGEVTDGVLPVSLFVFFRGEVEGGGPVPSWLRTLFRATDILHPTGFGPVSPVYGMQTAALP